MSIRDQLIELEREGGREARTGLVAVRFLMLADGRTESDVVALMVMRNGRRLEVERRPGESLDELEERANPGGSWRAFPLPVFSSETRALTPREWAEAVQIATDFQPNRGAEPPFSAP